MRQMAMWLVLVLSLPSCTTRSVTPTRNSRITIDTIYQQKIIALQPAMDSLCKQLHDSLYAASVDSILSIRNLEMNELVK
jgi:hypothetical protein